MSTSAPSPKLPAWVFYLADLALLAAAAFIADQAPRPLPNPAIFAIVGCVIAGAIFGALPRLVEYERQKNAVLDERQSSLEGLSQTIANSAEQISAVASGLHTITELTQKNLRQAEQLPHKLQEKIAEFQAQLANADATEKEELEKELATLRSSESERLESISDRIAKSVAEFARLQGQLQKQLSAASAALASAPVSIAAAPPPATKAASETPPESSATLSVTLPPPPKIIRTSKKEGASTTVVANADMAPAATHIIAPDEPPPVKPLEIAPIAPDSRPPYSEPASAGAEKITAVVAPPTAETAPIARPPRPARKRSEKKIEEADDNLLGLEIPDAAEPPVVKPVTLGALVADFARPASPENPPVASPAADGATRLLVTSYIGIGNRLFIRGEGPGLSWDKGIPLHFVSIGKWRWESGQVAAPVKFKLYKNDDAECVSLGLQTLAPGQEQEVSASF